MIQRFRHWGLERLYPLGDKRGVSQEHLGNHMTMNNPPHPGQSIRHDCLEPLGLTVTDAAIILGVTRQALNNVLNAKSGISPEMAVRLDLAFGGGAETWLKLQLAFDLPNVYL